MSRRSKYSVEEKVKTAEACLSGQMWISEASHRTGADEKNIRYKSEGASAFLPSEHNRTYPAELKRQAVEEYLAGKGSFSYHDYDISEKEQGIIELVAEGLSNREIAEKLYLSEGTVRNYISTILDKLKLRDRTQLAVFYYKNCG